VSVLAHPYDPIGDIAVDPTSGTLIATHPRNCTVSILDADDPDSAAAIRLGGDLVRSAIGAVVEVGELATQPVMSPDGAEIYVVDRDGVAALCALSEWVFESMTVDARPSCVAVSSGVGRLYVADHVGDVTVLPLATPVLQAVAADADGPALRIHKARCRTVIRHHVHNTNKESINETRSHDHGRYGGDPRHSDGGLFTPRQGHQRR
jgi:DNA-binding beta-propeller fold protein YncE